MTAPSPQREVIIGPLRATIIAEQCVSLRQGLSAELRVSNRQLASPRLGSNSPSCEWHPMPKRHESVSGAIDWQRKLNCPSITLYVMFPAPGRYEANQVGTACSQMATLGVETGAPGSDVTNHPGGCEQTTGQRATKAAAAASPKWHQVFDANRPLDNPPGTTDQGRLETGKSHFTWCNRA